MLKWPISDRGNPVRYAPSKQPKGLLLCRTVATVGCTESVLLPALHSARLQGPMALDYRIGTFLS